MGKENEEYRKKLEGILKKYPVFKGIEFNMREKSIIFSVIDEKEDERKIILRNIHDFYYTHSLTWKDEKAIANFRNTLIAVFDSNGKLEFHFTQGYYLLTVLCEGIVIGSDSE